MTEFTAKLRKASARVWSPVRRARDAHGAAQSGLHRLIDLHASSIAGDTLVAIGLAGTLFFDVPVGEARLKVGGYLVITMAPFALLAPLVGPMLDRFRHGRRYALAITMLARAFLAWVIADQINTLVLYPAAFGVLVASRAYSVARNAAIPRLLPPQLTLVEANARSSLAGTIAATLILPIGLLTAYIGPEWTLRLATALFVVGMVFALRLPPRADSQPPETLPRFLQLPGHKTSRRLFDTPIWIAVISTASLRALYGFLTLFFAFRAREDDLASSSAVAIGVIIAALGVGSFAATAVGTKLKLLHPLRPHVIAVGVAAIACVIAAVGYSLIAAIVLAFVTAFISSLSKLGVDAVLQQRIDEANRASAFAHSETFLQLAWVAGGAIGLIPFSGKAGLLVAAVVLVMVAIWLALRVWQLQQTPNSR